MGEKGTLQNRLRIVVQEVEETWEFVMMEVLSKGCFKVRKVENRVKCY